MDFLLFDYDPEPYFDIVREASLLKDKAETEEYYEEIDTTESDEYDE